MDLSKESQKPERRTHSIQYYMSAYLQATGSFDVLLDDDGSGEAADLVGLKVDGRYLDVTLVHCKYSRKPTPGTRVEDLYEVCGQAMRSAKWRRQNALPLLDHLHDRAVQYARRTGGVSPYEVGSPKELFDIHEKARLLRPRFHTIIVQPGLQARKATNEQLVLLAGAEKFVRDTSAGDFTVYCSR
ncbi:hypothetical protein [Streptomyces mirabilis]|uniref:hypothetical protein n=1 Tax=Streptomyces mirabilis TaxID=68239 RepID=UPI002250EAFC|nr:hypothetical protein [Streptomyces mirabilis]MCX4429045.1 hypothetical protein [Streptomyces mirabilis]